MYLLMVAAMTWLVANMVDEQPARKVVYLIGLIVGIVVVVLMFTRGDLR